jgi:hypothetical protein
MTRCPSRASAVLSAARALHASHVTDVTFTPGDDGSWVAHFDAVRRGARIHVRTVAEYHHHWYVDCYTPVGTAVTQGSY